MSVGSVCMSKVLARYNKVLRKYQSNLYSKHCTRCVSSVISTIHRHSNKYNRMTSIKQFTGVNESIIHKLETKRTVHCSPRHYTQLVFGIETSCDDTGAALVDTNGKIQGDALNSQVKHHTQFGGIIPPIASELHEQNIEDVVQTTFAKAKVDISQVDAIAATVKPGLPLSLAVGLKYAKKLVRKSGKPFIPIHHMEAHALTARMIEDITFPYLTFLLSGGHCLLAVVRDVEDFILLGKGLDIAPGEALDKLARRMKLAHIPEYAEVSGGRAIELLAQSGDPTHFPEVNILSAIRDCNFSFGGMRSKYESRITMEEVRLGKETGHILPNLPDLCASVQYSILKHLAKRLQRAFLYCELHELLPISERVLVLSGGVASNMFIRSGLEKVCSHYDCRLVCPPPSLCTDNGIMIAWNGIEKLRKGVGIVADIDSVQVQNKCPLGEDWTEKVKDSHLKCDRIKLLD